MAEFECSPPELENIWTASSDGDIQRVQQILLAGESTVNARDESGYTPMYDVNQTRYLC